MNCPSCGAPMRLTGGNVSLRCDYCGHVVAIAPGDAGIRFLDEDAEVGCPDCAEPLWKAVMARVTIRTCKKCQGILSPLGSFEELVDNLRAQYPDTEIPPPPNPDDLKLRITCPVCRQVMDTHFYFGGGHAVMATCEHCELHWLQAGVLMRIVRAPHVQDAQAQ